MTRRTSINTVNGIRFVTGHSDRDGYIGHATSERHGYLIGSIRANREEGTVELVTADHLKTYSAATLYELSKILAHCEH